MLIQPIIGAVLWSATCVTDGARGKVLKNWLGLSYLWRCRTPGEMRRTMDIIRRLTARSARPDLVLAAICSMVAAIIVLALKVTFGPT
jgi:hypothetical protein